MYTAFDYADIMEFLNKKWKVRGRAWGWWWWFQGPARGCVQRVRRIAPRGCMSPVRARRLLSPAHLHLGTSPTLDHPPSAAQVADRSFESGEAAEAQDYLIKMPDRIRKLSERAAARKSKAKRVDVQFSWIFNRKLSV